jgi:hypothetical protein
MQSYFAARDNVIKAVGEYQEALEIGAQAYGASWSQELAGEEIALAARALTEAVDILPDDSKPVGWIRDRIAC